MLVLRFILKLGGPKGVEPSLSAFTVRCSACLSHDPQKILSISDCQLPIELPGPGITVSKSEIGNWQSQMFLAGMTRLELANQLIEGQLAFHFAFIPKTIGTRKDSDRKSEIRNPKFVWYRRRDSNPHCLVPKTSASCLLGYAGKSKDEG
jgi:hypothetical protein